MSLASSTRAVHRWPVFECTACDAKLHNAFGNQLCCDCGGASTPTNDGSDTEPTSVWSACIRYRHPDNAGVVGPWLRRTKAGAERIIASELFDHMWIQGLMPPSVEEADRIMPGGYFDTRPDSAFVRVKECHSTNIRLARSLLARLLPAGGSSIVAEIEEMDVEE